MPPPQTWPGVHVSVRPRRPDAPCLPHVPPGKAPWLPGLVAPYKKRTGKITKMLFLWVNQLKSTISMAPWLMDVTLVPVVSYGKFHLHPWFLDGVNFAIARWSILGEDSELPRNGCGSKQLRIAATSIVATFFVAKFRAMPRVLYAQNDNLQYTKLSIPQAIATPAASFVDSSFLHRLCSPLGSVWHWMKQPTRAYHPTSYYAGVLSCR